MDTWVASTFWLQWIMLLWTFIYMFCVNMFLILLGLYLGMNLLGHMVTLCLTIWETAKLFSKAAAPFYISASNVWVFIFFQILVSTWCCLSFFLMGIIYLFIYFMAVLGLRFCARAFSSCGKWGPLFIAVLGPLTIAASLVAEHRLQTRRLSDCGSRAQLLHGMWDLPRPGL